MRQSLVSAIIPCYKQAQYVSKAIDSVLAQTYKTIEVIVVDDGSPDDLDQVLARYAGDARVRVIKQENAGLSAARNRGAAEARGAYLQFLDSDDWLHPDKFAIQVPVLDAEPAIGFVYSDFYHVYNDTEISTEWSASQSMGSLEPDIFNTLWLRNCVSNMTVLMRREWFDKAGGFDTTPVLAEDYEMWMRMTALGCKVRYIPKRLGYYRQHVTSMSRDSLQPARQVAARSLIVQRFPELIGPATVYSVNTMNEAWGKQVEQLQIAIKRKDEQIAALQRNAYDPRVIFMSAARFGVRRLRKLLASPRR